MGGRFLRIHSSNRRPPNAATGVRHRGIWLYIDDADLNSKRTIMMLSHAIALRAGDRVDGADPDAAGRQKGRVSCASWLRRLATS
jgi:hypothetical protein